mmetsp:Transcript_9610/g.10672  ORF Transcript_9610/g.10672 Transcript_9610/m.10672 type:complete len:213 (-) Transcript_9610:47-685(-)
MTTSLAEIKVIEQNDLLLQIMSFLDVTVLVQNKAVCQNWKTLCTKSIDKKCVSKRKFRGNKELRECVKRYLCFSPTDAEEFAQSYGWPMGRWDVSLVTNFSFIFYCQRTFNEDISAWDTSNATNMVCIFYLAAAFNCDISRWNTSKVKIMAHMFVGAKCFNQDISKWDVSCLELQSEVNHLFSADCTSMLLRKEYQPIFNKRKKAAKRPRLV